MKRIAAIILLLLTPVLLAACAIGDVASATTAPPPLTIEAPPTIAFSGTCQNRSDLEVWLQITSFLVADFQTTMNTAVAKTPADAYTDVQYLIRLRDSAFQAVTPDCAVEAQNTLSDLMDKAVESFQGYVNGTTADITGTIADLNSQFDQVVAAQNQLLARMDAQILGTIIP